MLVPSELTDQEFWQRFFFRVHQIKEEEEKRKAVLQGPSYCLNPDLFSFRVGINS